MAIEENYLKFFISYLYKKTGINIERDKVYLLESRLIPLIASLDLKGFGELQKSLQSNIKSVETAFIDALTTNETYFFRDLKPFEFFEKNFLPYIKEQKNSTIKIWSAACSSGQEAYSIAMILKNNFIDKKFKVEIIATDISAKILEKAREGIYSQFEVQRGLPIKYMMKYFNQISGNNWQIKKEISEMVTFKEFNLLGDYSLMENFDFIFCRNVLIYFDEQTKIHIIKELANKLNLNGYLSLGSAETNNLCPDKLDQSQEIRSLFKRKL